MQTPEFKPHGYTHEITVSDLPKNRAFSFNLTPDAAELTLLAEDLDIPNIQKLRFEGTLEFNDTGTLTLLADLGATVTQSCVVSLEPVKTRIDTEITRRFVPDLDITEEEHQMLPDDDENTDPLMPQIDLGLVLLESVALNLPDFPRIPGAELKQKTFTAPGVTPLTDEDAKPFASLAALKDKLQSNS